MRKRGHEELQRLLLVLPPHFLYHNNMEKLFIFGSIIVVGSIVIGIAFFWLPILSNRGPEFHDVRGAFVSGPIVEKSEQKYRIHWATLLEYPKNEVLLQKNLSRSLDGGVGATTRYDAAQNIYVHTAEFILSDSSQEQTVPVFEPGNYQYQVLSAGLKGTEPITSQILQLY